MRRSCGAEWAVGGFRPRCFRGPTVRRVAIVAPGNRGVPMSKDLLRNGEVIAGALLAALGVYIFLQSRTWDYYTPDGPGPGFFPTWYGVAMVALSLALIVNNVMRPKPVGAVDWQGARRALGTWATFAVAVALMWPLGFVISFALFTFVIVAVVLRRPL